MEGAIGGCPTATLMTAASSSPATNVFGTPCTGVLLSSLSATPCTGVRWHVEIPPIPDDLLDEAASTEHVGDPDLLEFEPFLAPAPAAHDEVDELSFEVICNALSVIKLVAFAFSLASRQWRAIASFSNPNYVLKNLCLLWFRQPAHGFFYSTSFSENFMLVLDTREMKFFVVSDIPHKKLWTI